MSDIEVGEDVYEGDSPDPDEDSPVEVHAEDLDDDEDDEGPAQPAASSRQFAELPKDYLTLVQAAHLLGQKRKAGGRNVIVKPQVLYSTRKNTKGFPAKQHTDGRWIVNREEFLTWWDEKEAKKIERAQQAVAASSAEDNESDS